MGTIMENILQSLDYANRYVTLKFVRTLLIATVLMLLILILRQSLLKPKKTDGNGIKLYIRMYLWGLLIPVPFLGTLKVSAEYFRWRSAIYVFLYEKIMGNPIWGRLYFAGMAAMVFWFLVRNAKIRREIRTFPVWEESRAVCGRTRKNVKKIQIRLSPFPVTPFTVGVIRPVVVLPERIVETFQESEIDAVLAHEWNHIRRGHLILYRLFDCFRVLWFFNPLIHLCARCMKDDLELICDRDTIAAANLSPEHYGMILIKSVECVGKETEEETLAGGTPALAARRSFCMMKKRIQMIAQYRSSSRNVRSGICGAAVIFIFLIFAVGRYFSYPLYTPYGDYSLFNYEGTQAVFMDNEEFNAAVTETEDALLIQNDKVKQMLERDTEVNGDEIYWIYYGGYMKMPGIGGGGEVMDYHPYETQDAVVKISFGEKSQINMILDWFMKHM